jgi:peptidylprolyl isomerase
MDSFKFRPKLSNLEDRLTPAVTPFEVFQAIEQTREVQQQMRDILNYFSGPVNVYAQSYFATVLPQLVDESGRSAVVLNEFHGALSSQIEANPDSSAWAREMIGGIGANLSHAYTNVTQTETTGVGLGAPTYSARHPVPVPPPTTSPEPPAPPEPPPVPRDDSGMTNTIPALSDPNWVNVGTSGLQIWDVTEGTGAIVEAGQKIEIHYTGWKVSDGAVFDSTRSSLESGASGDPASFELESGSGGVIEGWLQGIPGMRAGGIRRLHVPAALATGSAPTVPANAELVFEIKLIDSDDGTSEPPPVTRDESGMTSTVPSLTDPNWVSVGTAGLRMWDVTEGTGPVVAAGQRIIIHYTGWLASDGTVFDSSRPSLKAGATGDPANFDLDGLIQGWQQGIPGMRAGGIRRLDIPAVLGYGSLGSPPSIPPDARLVFEIKMFESQ